MPGKPGSTKLLGKVGNWKQALPEVPVGFGVCRAGRINPSWRPLVVWWFATKMLVAASRFVCVLCQVMLLFSVCPDGAFSGP